MSVNYRTEAPQTVIEFLMYHQTVRGHSQKTISEYYLVVFFPINEHVEPRGYTLPGNFKTYYDRICFVDSFFMNRIK